jgi:hypothetical protein
LELTRQYNSKSLNELVKEPNYEADLILSKLKQILLNTKSKRLEIYASSEVIQFINKNETFNKFINDNELQIIYKVSDKLNIKHLPYN